MKSLSQKHFLYFVVCILQVACGGGTNGAADSSVTNICASTSASTTNDNYVRSLVGDGSGLVADQGGGSDGGGSDGGGSAGDGEFVNFNIVVPTTSSRQGRLKWTVIRSQYGIQDSTGSLCFEKDTASTGGYKVVGVNGTDPSTVRSTQANIYVSTSGVITTTLPLKINGVSKDVVYGASRYRDVASLKADFIDYSGKYIFGYISSDVGTGANPLVSTGIFNLNSDGTGRICDETFIYSDNCINGLDVIATYDDPLKRTTIRVKGSPSQRYPIGNGYATNADIVAVMHKFGVDGLSFVGDFVLSGYRVNRTGAQYGSRISTNAYSLTNAIGAWSVTSRSIISAKTYTTQNAIANVNGVIKARVGGSGISCYSSSSTLTTNALANGVVNLSTPGIQTAYIVQMDPDLVAYVVPNQEIGFGRRFSTLPTAAACQPQ
jgi:hypothetical protein